MKIIRALCSILFAAGVILWSVSGLGDEPATGRVPTVTRLVKIFLVLEQEVASNFGKGNSAALEPMLTDDFELRVAAMPGNPTPRAEWLRRSAEQAGVSYDIEQMAVHDYGEVAIASFLQAATSGGKRDRKQDLFVVDVWKRAGTTWKLATRYAAPAGERGVKIPGSASDGAAIEKRY